MYPPVNQPPLRMEGVDSQIKWEDIPFAQRQAIEAGRADYEAGRFVTLEEFLNELDEEPLDAHA